MEIQIKVYRVTEGSPMHASQRVPLLSMETEFPELASANLRMLADRLDRENTSDPSPPEYGE